MSLNSLSRIVVFIHPDTRVWISNRSLSMEFGHHFGFSMTCRFLFQFSVVGAMVKFKRWLQLLLHCISIAFGFGSARRFGFVSTSPRTEIMVGGLPCVSTCIVGWLHRREIPRQGQLPNRMPMRRWCVFGVLERSAFLKTLDFENCQDWSTSIGYGFVRSWSHASPLRNKKATVTHAAGGMTPEFRKLDFFENIEAGEGSGHKHW